MTHTVTPMKPPICVNSPAGPVAAIASLSKDEKITSILLERENGTFFTLEWQAWVAIRELTHVPT